MPPLTLSEVNLKETEGMPEKARNGYAALSVLKASKLGMARKTCSTAVFLNVCKDLHTEDEAENTATDHNWHTYMFVSQLPPPYWERRFLSLFGTFTWRKERWIQNCACETISLYHTAAAGFYEISKHGFTSMSVRWTRLYISGLAATLKAFPPGQQRQSSCWQWERPHTWQVKVKAMEYLLRLHPGQCMRRPSCSGKLDNPENANR